MSASVSASAEALGAVIRPVSGTPVVALTIALVVAAVMVVLAASWFFHWRGGRR